MGLKLISRCWKGQMFSFENMFTYFLNERNITHLYKWKVREKSPCESAELGGVMKVPFGDNKGRRKITLEDNPYRGLPDALELLFRALNLTICF